MSSDHSPKDGGPAGPVRRQRFEKLVEIKRGGLGRIEVGYDPVLRRRVAVKTLLPDRALEADARKKFEKEAQITGQLEHPNIIPVYDLYDDGGEPFIVMKLIRGKSLSELLNEAALHPREPEELRNFVQILVRLCDALAYAHSRGVIHCDLKPDNVMVGDYGEVYVMDWGAALLRHDGTESAPSHSDEFVNVLGTPEDRSSLRGTPAYMAPEHFGNGEEIDERTDVFGLGAILYQILTGSPPNGWGRVLSIQSGSASMPSSSRLWARIPPGLSRIAIKALSPLREQRYVSIAHLKADLEQFLQGGGWFETRLYRAGEVIVREGDPGTAAYIIEHGQCEVHKTVQGQSTFLRSLGPGDVFGETAVLTRAPRTASVIAVSEVTLKVITGETLNQELDRNPWVAAFVRSVAKLFREADALARERLSEHRAPEDGDSNGDSG